MIWDGDVGRRCNAPTTHVVTLTGHDGEGVSVIGRFPPVEMCERCAHSVRPPHDDIGVVVRRLTSEAPSAPVFLVSPEALA